MRNCQIVFSSGWIISYTYPQCVSSYCSTFSYALGIVSFLFKLALILQCGLNFHFSNDWWWMIVWHLYIFFLVPYLLKSFALWKKLVCLFSYYQARRLIYIFLMQILYRRILEIFSPNLSPVFHLLNIAFWGTEDYNFDEVQFVKLLWVIHFLLYLMNLSNSRSPRFSRMFSCTSFTVLSFPVFLLN